MTVTTASYSPWVTMFPSGVFVKLNIPTLQFIVLRLIATAMLDDSIVSAVQTLDLVFQVGILVLSHSSSHSMR